GLPLKRSRFRDSPLHQPDADALTAQIRPDRKRAEQERRRPPDDNGPEANRAQERPGVLVGRDEREPRVGLDALAQAGRGFGEAAWSEPERHQRLNGGGIAIALRPDFPHGALPTSLRMRVLPYRGFRSACK